MAKGERKIEILVDDKGYNLSIHGEMSLAEAISTLELAKLDLYVNGREQEKAQLAGKINE